MRAYKFLAEGAVGRFSDFPWPKPGRAAPGEWVESGGPLPDCLNGIHACRPGDLVDWIDDELWEVELDGAILERDSIVVAQRGRLLRRIEGWNKEAAQQFADACAWRSREYALATLRRAGLTYEADRLADTRDLGEMQSAAAQLANTSDDPAVVELVAFAADAVSIARGTRPDSWSAEQPPAAGLPTAAASAANVGYVVAHVAGRAAAPQTPDAYLTAFVSERAQQTDWLVEHLQLTTD